VTPSSRLFTREAVLPRRRLDPASTEFELAGTAAEPLSATEKNLLSIGAGGLA
jgi:hypothetical protein